MRAYALLLGCLICLLLLSAPVARAQLNSQQLDSLMNQYDRPGLFPPQQGQQGQYAAPQRQIIRPQGMAAPKQTAAPVSPLQALFGAKPKPAPSPKPVNPLQYVMQQFLGGGSSGGGENSAQNSQKLYNAQEYLQTANDQASRAQSACERASYGSDKSARQSAASEAYYAAQAARSAADSATAAAAGGSGEANDAAAQARDAADRAQASADTASSNANNGGGW